MSQLKSFSIVASAQNMAENKYKISKVKFTLYFSKLEEINYSPYSNI